MLDIRCCHVDSAQRDVVVPVTSRTYNVALYLPHWEKSKTSLNRALLEHTLCLGLSYVLHVAAAIPNKHRIDLLKLTRLMPRCSLYPEKV